MPKKPPALHPNQVRQIQEAQATAGQPEIPIWAEVIVTLREREYVRPRFWRRAPPGDRKVQVFRRATFQIRPLPNATVAEIRETLEGGSSRYINWRDIYSVQTVPALVDPVETSGLVVPA